MTQNCSRALPKPIIPAPSAIRSASAGMDDYSTMHKTIRWRWGVVAAAAMTLLALMPQLFLWHVRERAWQGAAAYFYTDEPAYAAYVNALRDGRPRNDPYTGVDDTPATPLPESLFSIQFVPAYLIALPARALGLSTVTAFILLVPLVTFSAALALFWLLALVTGDESAAAAFVPLVLCLGRLLMGKSSSTRCSISRPLTSIYTSCGAMSRLCPYLFSCSSFR